MKNKLMPIIGILFSCFQGITADPVLTFFLKDYPDQETASYLLGKLKKPNALAKQTVAGIFQHSNTGGIFSSYFGFLNSSDHNGQTTFPRKHSNTKLKLIITDKIMPVMMFNLTVSHWELIPGTPAVLYEIVQQEDPTTKLTYWNVTLGTLPDNKQLAPTDSIILFAKPKNIYVPLGVTLAEQGPNLILPDMYVKKGIQTTRNALYVLNLSFLFRPIDLLYKKSSMSYESLVETE